MLIVKFKFTPEEKIYIRDNYPKHGAVYCSDNLKIDIKKIKSFTNKHKIKLNSDLYIKSKKHRSYFTETEINFLKVNYPNYGAYFCSEQLNKSVDKIKQFCQRNNITLSKHMRSLSRKNRKPFQRNYNTYNINPYIFIRDFTKESTYILGFIWGDGCVRHFINKSNNNCYVINICAKYDDMINVKHIFDATGKWYFFTKKTAWSTMLDISTGNSIIAKFLIDNDYRNKSFKSADKILSLIPDELKSYFFLGLSDADGCFSFKENTKRQYSITSTYEQDWAYFEKLCEKLQINYYIRKVITKKGHKCSYLNFNGYVNITKFKKYLYPNGFEFGFRRKYDKCINCITDFS